MRFDSVDRFIEFLWVLDSLGYQVPFLDYKSILKHSLSRHIHLYTCSIDVHKDSLYISLSYGIITDYYITLYKKGNV